MADQQDAVGVGDTGTSIGCWDASDEFVYYVCGRRGTWGTVRQELGGRLYLGPGGREPAWYSRWLGPRSTPDVRVLNGPPAQEGEEEPVTAGTDAPEGITEDAIRMGNQGLQLVFSPPAEGADCLAILHRLGPRSSRFVYPRSESPGLWRIRFRAGPEGASRTLELSNRDGSARATLSGSTLTLNWDELALDADAAGVVNVEVTIHCPPGPSPAEWRISVDNRSDAYGVWDVTFPLLQTVARPRSADVVLPYGNWGGRLSRDHTGAWAAPYPSVSCPVQFMLFHQGDAGLYVAAHDGAARTKQLQLTAEQDVGFVTSAEDMGVPGNDAPSTFAFVTHAYTGDWWQGAAFYRDWALGQSWTRKGPLRERRDVPSAFLDLPLWMLADGDPAGIEDTMSRAAARFRMPVGVHWYLWHQIPFDHSYPEYFPTRPGMAEATARMVEAGHMVMPYINARLWDQGIPSFAAQGIAASAKQPNGQPYTEEYGSGRQLAPMCPATGLWQDRVNEIVAGLIQDCGVNAIYLDQIAAAAPAPCFDPAHGHPLGGGRHWVDGYRAMLDRVKAQATTAGVTLTTENTAECYMDNIDGFLVWNPRVEQDVPLLPAVYAGHTVYFSSPRSPADTVEAFRAAQGRDFLWGCQLGWNGNWILDPAHRDKADFLEALCRCRLRAPEFLVYGRLLGEAVLTPAPPSENVTWNRETPHPATLPQVLATVWSDGDQSDRRGVFAVNWSSRPQAFAWSLPPHTVPQTKGPFLISRLTQEGPVAESVAATPRCEALLAPGEVRAWTAKPVAAPEEIPTPAQTAADAPAPGAYTFARTLYQTGLSIEVVPATLTVARGESATATVRIANHGQAPQELELISGEQTLRHRAPPGSEQDLKVRLEPTPPGISAWEYGEFTVRLGDAGGSAERTFRLPIERTAPVVVRVSAPSQCRGHENLVVAVELRNVSAVPRSGRLRLDIPESWDAEPARAFVVDDLAPGERRDFLIRVRPEAGPQQRTSAVSASFSESVASERLTILPARPVWEGRLLNAAPRIDAVLDEISVETPGAITLGGARDGTVRFQKPYGGADDCSARCALAWERNGLYFAALVRDNVHHQEHEGQEIWQGDCIQLAVRNGAPNTNPDYDGREYELGLALTGSGPQVFRWTPSPLRLPDVPCAVRHENGYTVYEALIPWAALGRSAPEIGERVTGSVTVNDNDGEGFRGWLEWTGGICGSKDSSRFGWIRFTD
jgi:hypothetical protein